MSDENKKAKNNEPALTTPPGIKKTEKIDDEPVIVQPKQKTDSTAKHTAPTQAASDAQTVEADAVENKTAATAKIARPKTEQFQVPVVEPEDSTDSYKYVRKDKVQNGATQEAPTAAMQSAPATAKMQTPSTENLPQTQTGGAGNSGGGKRPPVTAASDVFGTAPQPLNLTPQINRDYAHITPPVKKKTVINNGSKKKVLAAAAGAAILFGGGALLLDDSTSSTPSSNYVQGNDDSSNNVADTSALAFGKPAVWNSKGLEISVPDPKIAASTELTDGTDASSYLVFSVTLKNNSDHTIRASQLQGIYPQVYYGSSQKTAKQVTDDTRNVTDENFASIEPGATQTIRFGFRVPDTGLSKVTLDMGKPSGTTESAIFSGSYQK